MDLDDWLPELRERHKDYHWIAARADQLFQATNAAVRRPPQHRKAFEALTLLHSYIVLYDDWARWLRPWYDTLINLQNVKDSRAQTYIWNGLSGLYAVSGDHKRVRAALQNSLERAEEDDDQDLLLAAYIGLIQLQCLHQDEFFTPELIERVLRLAKHVNQFKRWGQLHQALAMAYNHRGETDQALGHGQMAYAYWLKMNDTVQMARAAFTLSQVCRIARLFPQAVLFLNVSRTLYAQNPSGARHAVLDYHQGLIYLDQENYVEAADWLHYALQELSRLNQQHFHVAAAQHSLGIALVHLRRFDEAQANFEAALTIWQEQQNDYEHANLYYALALMEKLRGNTAQAVISLKQALAVCVRVPPSSLRTRLQEEMRALLTEIDKPPAADGSSTPSG
ncbi:MAG: tetratricopeptide repeat protein [Chloroflexi bacterium]|nr:tetratricopeptide repeat protein [Chloroflexota bacterium]